MLLSSSLTAFSQTTSTREYKEDFGYFWKTINDEYCYFNKKPVDWNKIRELYAPQIDTVQSRNAFITVLERVMNELYDHHCSLRANTPSSSRLVPTSADMWAEFRSGRPVITEVRKDFGAEQAGIRAGMEVVAVNDVPVEQGIQPFLAHTKDEEARNYALRLLLAGDHKTPRKITLRLNKVQTDHYPDKDGLMLENVHYVSKVESRSIGDIGYIRINNFLFDNSIIPLFDSVLSSLSAKKAIILDMRETPSGGNTSVARAILGRFTPKEQFYQKHEYYAEEKETGIKRSWVEMVSPRAPLYSRPLVVLADHWTGSISEGITTAFDGMKLATVIGTPMARLNGAVISFEMPNTKIGFNISAERLYQLNGQPRENFIPPVEVDASAQKPGPGGDVILNTALAFLQKKIK